MLAFALKPLHAKRKKKKKTHCYSAGQSANLSVCRAAPLMRAGLFAPETLDNESATESSWSPLVSSGGRKWSEAKQPVAIILAIDRARSVLCLICLVCQVKGGPSSACGKTKIYQQTPANDAPAFSCPLSSGRHRPSNPSVGVTL